MRRTRELHDLYVETYGFVFNKARAILHNEADAKEVAQEVYLRAHENWKKLDKHPSRIGWLLTTTSRVSIDRLRRRRVAEARLPALKPRPPESPEGAFAAAEMIDAVLAQTSELGRHVALHVHLDGMTQEETAMVLNVSRKTVQRHLERFKGAMTEANDE